MRNTTPFLWFNDEAEEAANFYVSLFKNSDIDTGKGEQGAMTVIPFVLDGQSFNAINGGPQFKSSEAISFVVNCETQDEVDFFWEKLSEGGTPGQCGWVKDRFGISWQIVPTAIDEFMAGDTEQAKRVMGAMLKMTKIEIKGLREAFEAV